MKCVIEGVVDLVEFAGVSAVVIVVCVAVSGCVEVHRAQGVVYELDTECKPYPCQTGGSMDGPDKVHGICTVYPLEN